MHGTRETLIVGVPDILVQDSYDKEVADSVEVGFKSLLFGRRVGFNGAAFYTEVQNAQQFEFFPTGGIQAISSIKKVRIKGFEFDINARLTDNLTLLGGFGLADTEITDINPADRADIIGNRLPFAADYNLAAGFQLLQPLGDTLSLLARADSDDVPWPLFERAKAVRPDAIASIVGGADFQPDRDPEGVARALSIFLETA